MRWREIVGEEYLVTPKKETVGVSLFDRMYATLSNVLMMLRQEYDETGNNVINTDSIINMVKNAGYANFDYHTFVSAQNHPTIAKLVKNYNKSTVVLNVDEKSLDSSEKTVDADPTDSEEIVKKMAKSSLKKREM